MALEKLSGIESQDSKEELLLWPESKGEEMEVLESKEKGKQKEEMIDRAEEEEEVGEQKEENRMENIEERSNSFTPVAFSVGTRIL